jgi:hypothetical protein
MYMMASGTGTEVMAVEVITDRYHVLGRRKGATLSLVLKPGNYSRRLFQLVVRGIGPPGS